MNVLIKQAIAAVEPRRAFPGQTGLLLSNRESPAAIPGSGMGYDGINDDGERRDLILFLSKAGRTARCQERTMGAAHLP